MSKTKVVLLRIVGSVVGLLAGGALLCAAAVPVSTAILAACNGDDEFVDESGLFIFGPLGALLGAVIGAAAGATITQKALRQRCSFWRVLLGTVVGCLSAVLFSVTLGYFLPWSERLSLAGLAVAAIAILCASIVAGAVIGSGWKSKPADTTKVES